MMFLKTGDRLARGFRTSEHDRRMITEALRSSGCSEGSLVVNLVRVSDGHKKYGMNAIWSSGKIRVVDARFRADDEDNYVVEVVSIRHRLKGERV